MNFENTAILPKSESELVLTKKTRYALITPTVLFLFHGTKTLSQSKVEEIKHKFQRKHKTCDTINYKACNLQ